MRFVPPDRSPSYVNDDLWWLHGLFSLLILVALIVGAVVLVRLYLRRPAAKPLPPSGDAG